MNKTSRLSRNTEIISAVPRYEFRVLLCRWLTVCLVGVVSFGVVNAAPCPCSDPNLCNPINVTRDKEVVVFSVEGITEGPNWHRYDWDHITTVIYFHKPVDEELMCYAHSRGVRVVEAGEFSKAILPNETARMIWVNSTLQRALDNHLDGINLDIELAMNKSMAPLVTTMVQEITDAFHAAIPGSRISFDAPFTANSGGRPYEYDKIAAILDYIVIMAYDMPFAAGVKGVANSHDPYQKIVGGIQSFLSKGIPGEKLVLAVPWYGYTFPCTNFSQPHNICYVGEFECFRCAANGGAKEIGYKNIMQLARYNATSPPIWNDTCESVYISYKNITSGQMHQVYFDNPASLSLRYYLADIMGLRGVSMWTVDSLDYSDDPIAKQQTKEMWDALNTFFDADGAPHLKNFINKFSSFDDIENRIV